LGAFFGQRSLIPHGPLHGPQGHLDGLKRRDIRGWTHTARAVELSRIPKRSGVFFGSFNGDGMKVQRIPRAIPEDANFRLVRDTLVARSRLVRTVTAKQGA
jgi:hypothetical protein